MAVDNIQDAHPSHVTGSWTSTACCATAQTETIGFTPELVIVIIDSGGTNPNILVKHNSETDEGLLITGSTGVITSPADAANVSISGNTFVVAAAAQTASGTNQYIAFR